MKPSFRLRPDSGEQPTLRTIQRRDLENLRGWKNTYRDYFFHKDVISAEAQLRWFDAYQQRPEDVMFVVEVHDEPVGCMGVRMLCGEADAYNIIRGSEAAAGRGIMSTAFRMMCTFAESRFDGPIGLRVLRVNPAVDFYKRMGLQIVGDEGDHFTMRLNPGLLRRVPWVIEPDGSDGEGQG